VVSEGNAKGSERARRWWGIEKEEKGEGSGWYNEEGCICVEERADEEEEDLSVFSEDRESSFLFLSSFLLFENKLILVKIPVFLFPEQKILWTYKYILLNEIKMK
jgi:hypothetical protein